MATIVSWFPREALKDCQIGGAICISPTPISSTLKKKQLTSFCGTFTLFICCKKQESPFASSEPELDLPSFMQNFRLRKDGS
jgi:hypothetical protein